MPDAHKGHGAWIERLDSPSDAEGDDSRGPARAGEPASTSREGDSASSDTGTWQAYLDSTPEATLTPSPDRPDADSGHRAPRGGEPSEPQAAPDPRVTELQRRWLYTQAQLLDDPREAVLEAGRLIGDAMRLAAGTVDEQRNRIERKWQTDAHIDTDELRSVMQRYRGLFQYVLAADALVGEVEAVRGEHMAAAAERPHDSARGEATAAQDGLAAVLQPGRAARHDAEPSEHRRSWQSRAVQWLTGLGRSWSQSHRARWVAGAALLLLLLALPAAYGLWRWQRPGSEETTTQARTLTVEPLHYPSHARSPRPFAAAATAELGGQVGGGDETGFDSPSTEARSPQPAATGPAAEASRPTDGDPTQVARSADAQSPIQRVNREREPGTPELGLVAPTVATAAPTDAEALQTEPEALSVELEPALPEPTQAPAPAPAQQATSTPPRSADLSQIQPVTVEPEPSSAESRAATATAEEDVPSVPQTQRAAQEPEPQQEVSEPATRRGDLAQLSDPGVARPTLVVAPRADYPTAAQRLRREAVVELRVLVDEQGMPTQIQPAGQSAGLGFDEAARMAVERARWRPATKDGVPVKVWIQTAVRFQLDGR